MRPRLPAGLDLVLVDDYSAQIVGVPHSESPSVDYAITARNRLGGSSTHIRYVSFMRRTRCPLCFMVASGALFPTLNPNLNPRCFQAEPPKPQTLEQQAWNTWHGTLLLEQQAWNRS